MNRKRLSVAAQAISDQAWAVMTEIQSDIGRIACKGPNGSDYDAKAVRTLFHFVDAEIGRRRCLIDVIETEETTRPAGAG